MKGEDAEAAPACSILQSELITDSGLLGDGQEVAQGIDHDVADHEDAAPGPAFFQEVLDGTFFSNKEIVGESVGEDAVDLLRHCTVKAAEPGLDVSHADAKFRSAERNSNGGIDITDDENQVRFASTRTGSMRFRISAVCDAWSQSRLPGSRAASGCPSGG